MSTQPAEGAAPHGWIASDTPGRMRVRLRRGMRDDDRMAHVADDIRGRAGISGVETNSRTGSITVRYDPRARTRDDVARIFHDLGLVLFDFAAGISGEPVEPGRSRTAHNIATVVGDLDRRLSRVTGRRVDLKIALPLTFAALGIWRTAEVGLQVPGYVLLWWAFDSFLKLNVPQHPARRA